jgi:hypothetical protein
LLGPEAPGPSLPDIDAAWSEALRALGQASIGPSDAPLYLVLGRPVGGENSLFNAAGLQLAVQQTPRQADAPLHIYANRDAIFVTCNHACLLSEQAHLFAEHVPAPRRMAAAETVIAPATVAAAAAAPAASVASVPSGSAAAPSVAQAAPPATAQATPAAAQQVGSSEIAAASEGAGAKGTVEAAPTAAPASPVPAPTQEEPAIAAASRPVSTRPLLRQKPAMELASARLAHLCRLIAQERQPYCPINGLILLVPLAATEGDAEASQVASLAQADVQTARAGLQVDCPIFVLICDLEQAPGFRYFLEQIPEPERLAPLGQRFPLLPDVDAHEVPHVLEGGMDALCQHALPGSIYNLFRLESSPDNPARMNGTLTANARLYQFLSYLRQGRKRLGRLVYRGAHSETPAAPMIAGCYFAATGQDARHEQAFVAGVFREIVEQQNYVSWTAEALRQESSYRRAAGLGYVLLVVILALAAGVVYWLTRLP